MPVVVDEVVITVEVDGSPGEASAGGSPSNAEERQAIVAECVERVLEILQQREEP